MVSQVLNVIQKNKKVILSIAIGGVCIVGTFFIVFNIDRAIKDMKLDYAGAINEYKNVLMDVKNKLANEMLNAFEKAQLEKTRQHCLEKISELESKAKKGV